jgi:hypothetical protein
MTAVARVALAMLRDPAILDLPRWRVIADARERFGCSDWAARTAYAEARINGHRRNRRSTVPHVRMEA